MVTTALALSSVKSSPSLTFPLHTAISRAPSGTKHHMMSGVKMTLFIPGHRLSGQCASPLPSQYLIAS